MNTNALKSFLLLGFLALLTFSCQVNDRRTSRIDSNGNRLDDSLSRFDTGIGLGGDTTQGTINNTNTDSTTTTTTTTTNDNFPQEFNHCRGQFSINGIGGYRFGSSASNSPLGPYNICRNANNEVLIQPQIATTNVRICVIPAIKNIINGTEITTSLGSAQCSIFSEAGGYYRFALNVTRPGANINTPINSVVLVRDTTHVFNSISNPSYSFFFQGINPIMPASQAFITCMNAIDAFQSVPNGLQAAIALCEEFKQVASFDDPTI